MNKDIKNELSGQKQSKTDPSMTSSLSHKSYQDDQYYIQNG